MYARPRALKRVGERTYSPMDLSRGRRGGVVKSWAKLLSTLWTCWKYGTVDQGYLDIKELRDS